jgi:hypothetical protein
MSALGIRIRLTISVLIRGSLRGKRIKIFDRASRLENRMSKDRTLTSISKAVDDD